VLGAQPLRAFEHRREIAEAIELSIPAFERFRQPLKVRILELAGANLMMKVAGTERDETEKRRNLLSLNPIFLRLREFHQMGNRRIGRAIAAFLMAEAVPQQRICRFTVP